MSFAGVPTLLVANSDGVSGVLVAEGASRGRGGAGGGGSSVMTDGLSSKRKVLEGTEADAIYWVGGLRFAVEAMICCQIRECDELSTASKVELAISSSVKFLGCYAFFFIGHGHWSTVGRLSA